MLLHAVVVELKSGPVVLSWPAYDALMRRLQHARETVQIRAAFTAAGTSWPVELRPGQRGALLLILEDWAFDLSGCEPIPEDLIDLREALAADLGEHAPPVVSISR